tara:strand:- start:4233 stop:5576 length:1344 start_codon:yes stop_codon:yes gene_type:complete
MAIKEAINQFFYKLNLRNYKKIEIFENRIWVYLLYLFFLILAFFLYNKIINFEENKSSYQEKIGKLTESKEVSKINEILFTNLRKPYKEINYKIKNNDSIEKILNLFLIDPKEVNKIIDGLKSKKLTRLYAGREFKIIFKKNDIDSNSIVRINYPISNTLSVEVKRNRNEIIIEENVLKLLKKEVLAKNLIKNNLYSSAVKAGIEPNIIIEFARIYGFEIDFQRDIRKDDEFRIFYERFIDERGVVRDTGKILYASMTVNNKEINLYNFKAEDEIGYYDIGGKSIVKSLMKTPINGARLSSSFGMRKHPILGFSKMHTGTDFAAPTGTPIMASGSGTVTRARWCGGGGNCVKIRHNSTYETVYAHMKNFAKGIKEGKKVTQGQIIGYVGSTGMSTGPHLHYEVIVNKKKVNSQKLKLPSGKILKGEDRKKFEIERIKMDLKIAEFDN